jgi:hypothetical protein
MVLYRRLRAAAHSRRDLELLAVEKLDGLRHLYRQGALTTQYTMQRKRRRVVDADSQEVARMLADHRDDIVNGFYPVKRETQLAELTIRVLMGPAESDAEQTGRLWQHRWAIVQLIGVLVAVGATAVGTALLIQQLGATVGPIIGTLAGGVVTSIVLPKLKRRFPGVNLSWVRRMFPGSTTERDDPTDSQATATDARSADTGPIAATADEEAPST